ncbi:MAG: DUF1801 domain-containing protein [Ilumatobacter sp.]|nr:DUF1801 domain-containing protein [Ilumatobacter sp.]
MVHSGAANADEYIAELPPERADVVERVRQFVLDNLPPGVEETVNFGMIAYEIPLERYPETYNGQPLMYAALAAQKHHYALYLNGAYASDPARDALRDAYAEAGKKFDMGKSCLRFKRYDDLHEEAVAEALRSISVDDFIGFYEASRRR